MRSVPSLARGDLEIVAIARRPGVLSKVAVRRRTGARLSARPVSLVVGLGADYVRRVSAELGGERIHVVQWQGDPARYVAEALGLGYLPPIEVSAARRLANVWLGDIDVRGTRGWHGTNLLLASALTGWRIRLREIVKAPAWQALERAGQSARDDHPGQDRARGRPDLGWLGGEWRPSERRTWNPQRARNVLLLEGPTRHHNRRADTAPT
jgi:N utilization substance protein A